MQCVGAICNAFENYPAAYLWDLLLDLKGRKCKFCDYGDRVNGML